MLWCCRSIFFRKFNPMLFARLSAPRTKNKAKTQIRKSLSTKLRPFLSSAPLKTPADTPCLWILIFLNVLFFWIYLLNCEGENSRLAVRHGWYNICLCIIIRELAQVPEIPTYCNAETGLEFTFFLTLQFWWHHGDTKRLINTQSKILLIFLNCNIFILIKLRNILKLIDWTKAKKNIRRHILFRNSN